MPLEAPTTSTQVGVGALFGLHFPSSRATWPHPSVITKIFDEPQRSSVIKNRGLKDEPIKALCLALMISHSPPGKGEFARQLSRADIAGTILDQSKSIYVCFRHYQAVLMPGPEREIMSVESSYLGKLDEKLAASLMSNLVQVQQYQRGDSHALDRKIICG